MLLEFGCFTDSMVGPYSAVLLLKFLLKIRSVRILDLIVCSETSPCLLSLAWDNVEFILQVGFICPFMVTDPTNSSLGVTIVVAQA